MKRFGDKLKGGDLRSIGQANRVVQEVSNQQDFDELFRELFNPDRKVVMRAADAIEKITLGKPEYLESHKQEILILCNGAPPIELKWHLALLLPRLVLTEKELDKTARLLSRWAGNRDESKIVRVNALQSLFGLGRVHPGLEDDYKKIAAEISKENVPSLQARIRKLAKQKR